MVSESKRTANVKWDRENMITLSCRVRKTVGDRFKEACTKLGTVPNQVLIKAVEETIRKAEL